MENMKLNSAIESTLPKYLEFKVFELFRNRFLDIIKPHCRENSKEDIYKHLFICPSQMSKKHNFKLTGVLSPFVCMWRTSPLAYDTDDGLYGRSILARHFIYNDKDGKEHNERGFLYDLQFDIELFASGYYRTFRDRVNQDIIDMDRLRYFSIDVKELLKDCTECKTVAELMLTNMQATDNADDSGNNRSFDLNLQYTVKITVPYCHTFNPAEGIRIYLNDNIIYERDGETEIFPGKNESDD